VSEVFPPSSGGSAVGAQIAGYRLEEQIGRGGMAVVYRALDIRLDRWVALKIMAPEAARDQAFRQRFIQESRAAAAVDHPHIIPIFEAGEASGVLFIAMRYVSGGDVRALVSRLGPLNAIRVSNIIGQVASALDAAHASGLVHRDVKPGNMLIGVVAGSGNPDHVYLADFGLSKQSLSSPGLTATGQFLGTLDYVAPEQIEGRPVDGRADLYGLACTAFEMLSGTPPFSRDQNLALMWAQLSEHPPPLSSRRAGLPPPVDRVLARALAKSPDDRYQTCLDFAAALRDACEPRPSEAPKLQPYPRRPATELAGPAVQMTATARARSADRSRPVQPAPPPRPGAGPGTRPLAPPGARPAAPPPRRRSRAVLAVAGVVIIAIAGGAYAVLRGGGSGPRAAASAAAAVHSSSAPGGHATTPGPAPPAGPAATVRAYFTAINHHDYARAWRLGGRNAGSSYSAFEQGFATTARDTATILSVAGDLVTARIVAQQTNGIVKTYQGSYTVEAHVITNFDVRQLS
jgi:serine/threonine-protein kinase